MPKKKYKVNPPSGAVKIYENAIQIKAEKHVDSLWPKELFKHDFKKGSNVSVYGLPNGCILLIGNQPLWKWFGYEDHER